MKLKAFRVKHFRSLYDTDWIPVHDLTAFIGQNNGGKSSAVEVLRLLFGRAGPASGDYSYRPDRPLDQETDVDIYAVLELSEREHDLFKAAIGLEEGSLNLKKQFTIEGSSVLKVICSVPNDPRFQQDLDRPTVDQLKELAAAAEVRIPSSAKKAEIVSRLREYGATLPKVQGEVDYPSGLVALLPRVEVIASARAQEPEQQVLTVLRTLFRDLVRGEEFSGSFGEIQTQISDRLNKKVAELQPIVKKYYEEVESVRVTPTFDFASGLTSAPIQLSASGGSAIDLSRTGDGKRRQVILALFEWQSEMLKDRGEEEVQPLILALDEPDTHLDYESQRKLFDILLRFVQPTVQVIICTHSMNLIDRLAVTKVNHFSLIEHRVTRVQSLSHPDQQTEDLFLNEIGRNLGLSTGVIFHERCFLIVEGETEYNAIPVLFRFLYSSTQDSLQSCGIKLVNGENNVGAKNFAKFLNNNRRPVVFLVDEDSRVNRPAEKFFTGQSLTAAGFDLTTQVYFVGTVEFEDAFSDAMYVRMANSYFPKAGETQWEEKDFAGVRGVGKFSERVKGLLAKGGVPDTVVSKPEIGYRLAQSVRSESEIPKAIKDLFDAAIRFGK
jgi:putative ATP-dependent endonuclease of OLD family